MDLVNQLDKLKAFKIIAESGTMREAAKRLHVTQPSLTKLVKSLENAVGIELLSRGRHGVIPTDAGRQLQGFATSTLKALEDLEQKLLNPLDHMAGHLRVGAYASLSEYLWPNFIPAFRKKFPNLRISINTSDGIAHRGSLVQGEIDILVEAEPHLSNDLISWNLYDDRFNFFMHRSGETVWTADLIKSMPLIYSPNAFDRNHKKIIQYLEARLMPFSRRLRRLEKSIKQREPGRGV